MNEVFFVRATEFGYSVYIVKGSKNIRLSPFYMTFATALRIMNKCREEGIDSVFNHKFSTFSVFDK